jgi:hypothetical protein
MKRTLLFILLVCSAATTNCLSANAAHKIIMTGMTIPGIVVALSFAHKNIKTVVCSEKAANELAALIKDGNANKCPWLRPQ